MVASALPWLLADVFHVTRGSLRPHAIPRTVRFSFSIGAAAFLGAVLWTIVTTKEYPPVGVGIAWASILSMPYAILAAVLPANRIGVYMGIFKFFVVVPEIVSALFFGFVVLHVFHNDRMLAVAMGGVCLPVAVGLMTRVTDPQTLRVAG